MMRPVACRTGGLSTRTTLALVLVGIALPFALAGYPEPEPDAGCPTYTEHVQAAGVGVWNGGYPGSGVAALRIDVDDLSIIEDWLYVNNVDHFGGFSLWIYEESNHLAGLQRGDDVCVDTPPGFWSDTIVNS